MHRKVKFNAAVKLCFVYYDTFVVYTQEKPYWASGGTGAVAHLAPVMCHLTPADGTALKIAFSNCRPAGCQ